jgi:hypothetical protein
MKWRQRDPGRALYLPRDLHLNAVGNQLVADALVRALGKDPAQGTLGKP